MPSRDYLSYHAKLPALIGKQVFATLATNSIKLHVGENKKSGSYLWIDPPWAFGSGDDIIESSDSCPDYKSGDYESKFRQWVSRFSPIFTSSIMDIEADVTGQLSIALSDGYRIFAPEISSSADDSDLWYDHWYYKDEKSE